METFMAQAVADKVGATKRQIQLWTDGGAIRCLPGTDRQGRGRQRLYDQSELPFAAFVTALARHKIPIGDLVAWCDKLRNAGWYDHVSEANRNVETYFVLCGYPDHKGARIIWAGKERKLGDAPIETAGIIINVRKMMDFNAPRA